MTPFYLSQISPTPLKEGDQDQRQLLPFTLPTETTTFPFPILFDNPQDRVSDRFHHPQQILFEPKPIDPLLIDEPSDPVSFPTINNNNNNTIERSLCSPYVGHQDPQGSGKWMSSKMRIMRKMLNSDQATMNKPKEHIQVLEEHQQLSQDISNSSSTNSLMGGFIRVCSDCNTTKTPLWRSGPRGPKSLCNACGIRQRKARRAMALGSVLVPTKTPSKLLKEKRSEVQRTVPFKKRCKITASGTAQKKLQFEDVTINLSKNPAVHRVFPQDERDAAILLMALSCGLILS